MDQLRPLAIVSEGVDYITCTFTPEASTTRFFMEVGKTERKEIARGNLVQKWGHSGYLGQRCGGLEFGTSYQGCIVRLSGETAQTQWRRYARLCSNVSRLDVQQTVIFEESPGEVIQRCFDALTNRWSKMKRAPQPKMWSGPHGPETVYSGERVSDVFLRCYHRGARKGHELFDGHVRFEAELKNDRARSVTRALLKSRSQAADAGNEALGLFATRGCCLSWSGNRPPSFRRPKLSGTASSRLLWLESQVRPTVRELVELGMLDQVLRALGLTALPSDVGCCLNTKGENE